MVEKKSIEMKIMNSNVAVTEWVWFLQIIRRASKDLYQPNLSTLRHIYFIIVYLDYFDFASPCEVPWYIYNSLVVLHQ